MSVLILTGILASVSSMIMGFILNSDPGWRNPGTLADILSFSTILMMVTIMTFSRVLFQPGRHPWLIFAAVILLFALLITLTRQTWLGVFTGFLVLLYYKKRILVSAAPILVILILFLVPQTISDRILSIFDLQQASNQERVLLWKAGLEVFQDHPVTGCGLSCLRVINQNYVDHPILQRYQHVHSNPLQIAVDTGAIGLISWCLIWVAYLRILLIKYKRMRKGHPHQWVLLGSASVVIGFLTAGMFENTFYDSEISMVLYFIMALPFALTLEPSKNLQPKKA